MDSKVKVLLIEDETDMRLLYTEVLTDAGFTVQEAADGHEGLNYALNSDWDLMLLDIMIPKVDGVSLLKDVRANKALDTKPIVLLTNLGSEHLITECFEHGADGYLIKAEITPDNLVDEVNTYL